MSFLTIVKEALWSSTISKLVDISAAICTLLGFNLTDISILNWIPNNLGWPCMASIGINILLIRVVYVAYNQYANLLETFEIKYDPVKIQEYFNKAELIANKLNQCDDIDSEEYLRQLVQFCTNARILFDKITGASCSVSIKVMVNDSPVAANERNLSELNVKNLVRDTDHLDRDTEKYKNTEHKIRSNTAYITIIDRIKSNKQKIFYLCNNADVDNEYQTTSIECYGSNGLPYKSEIVYPLIGTTSSTDKSYYILGFLCVDCEKKDAFKAKGIEVHMIELMASSVYGILRKHWQQSA